MFYLKLGFLVLLWCVWYDGCRADRLNGGQRCRDPIQRIAKADFESEWVSLSSQAGSSSFLSVQHNLGELPVRVKVFAKAVGGPNDGYIFEGMGSASGDDETSRYGGVVYSYNENQVRIWAPDANNDYENGCIISTGGPFWGDRYEQCTHRAMVKVQAWLPATFPCPDIVTEWFDMKSGGRVGSFKEIEHNLGERPSLVVVQYKAKNGGADIGGFVHDGVGAAQCDDDRQWANYGGVVYATDPWNVRLWAPSRHDIGYSVGDYHGAIFSGLDGWGGEAFAVRHHNALVKVSIWKTHMPEPDYKTDWFMQMGQGAGVLPFREIRLPSVIQPDLVQVEVQAIDGPNQGFVFYGMGAQQAHADINYGGVVFGYTDSGIRLWSPSTATGGIINVIDGWGGEANVQSSKVAMVTVNIWQTGELCEDPVIIVP